MSTSDGRVANYEKSFIAPHKADIDRLLMYLHARTRDLSEADRIHIFQQCASATADIFDDHLRKLVADGRSKQLSWQHIGDALGTTRQGAHQRYASDDDRESSGL
jgi:hypothetical protein